MKIAIVHDWLTGMRGGEKYLEVFCRLSLASGFSLRPNFSLKPIFLNLPLENLQFTIWVGCAKFCILSGADMSA
jgi:hypothetical protein